MAHFIGKILASQKFKVELWVNTIGVTPEVRLIKVVEAESRDDAIDRAISLVKIENPEVNAMQIDIRITEKLYH
jgi:hypothetical protein